MFERLELLIGKENLEKIKKTKICIIGLGGVGGHVVESLIRSGIENIIIVDPDVINKSNLNRQIIATTKNIGKYKTDEFEKRILSINKNVKVKKITEFITKDNIDILFKDHIDYFIDACDTISTKEEIIKNCVEKKIKLITSLGMGKKMDPSKIKITTLSKTSYDPIAKRLRKYIKDNNIKEDIICCFSEEKPIKSESKDIGSNSFVPASAGILITSYIINDIIKTKLK